MNAISVQARRLQECKDTLADLKSKGCSGDLDFALSDLFPYSFAAISDKFAVIGLFFATGSYADGPMMVVDLAANRDFCEMLRHEWGTRWDDAIAQQPEEHEALELKSSSGSGDSIVSDTKLIKSIEARASDKSDIWVAAPDLSNVGDSTSPFSELVRSTVRKNAERGVNYSYVFPHEWAGQSRLENLRQCFVGTSGRLHVYEVPPERFLELTLVPCHFISFAPLSGAGMAYMQLPLAQAERGWIRLNTGDRERVETKLKDLMRQYPEVV